MRSGTDKIVQILSLFGKFNDATIYSLVFAKPRNVVRDPLMFGIVLPCLNGRGKRGNGCYRPVGVMVQNTFSPIPFINLIVQNLSKIGVMTGVIFCEYDHIRCRGIRCNEPV